MSSSSSVVSSSTEQSISQNELELPRIRRPARMAIMTTNLRRDEQDVLTGKEVERGKVIRGELYPRRHRDYGGISRRVDQIMKAPPNMKGGLVVIRSFCRYPPEESEGESACPGSFPSSSSTSKFFFYNVTAATCVSRSGGQCTQSRNRFPSLRTCLKACIVQSHDNSTPGDE